VDETLTVDVVVTNDGGVAGSSNRQDVELAVDGSVVDSASVELAEGASSTVTLAYEPTETRDISAEVLTNDDSVAGTLKITDPPAPPSSGGGGDEDDDRGESDDSDETPDDSDTEPSISFDNAEWIGEGDTVELIATNQDDVAIQQLEIIIDWYDKNGNFVGWDSQRVPALGAGKSWYLHVERSTDQIAESFEATAEGIRQERQIPDDLTIQSVNVNDVGDIQGILSNNRPSEVGVNMVATVYDDGWLTNTGSTSQSRIPAGADWSFQFSTQFVDADIVPPGDEIELFVTDF